MTPLSPARWIEDRPIPRYTAGMRKEELDHVARRRPFEPIEMRLVDGRIFRFDSPEQFIVSRSAIYTLDDEGDGLLISLGLIATVKMRHKNGRRGHS